MKGYKIFTHDFRSPLQGGPAVWDGSVPFQLPKVVLDTSDSECGAGWNFTDSIEQGFQIAGMWPIGRPSVVAVVEANGDAIQRGNKWRASAPKIIGLATEVEVAQAIERFSKVFKGFESEMVVEQLAWRYALGRPESNKKSIAEALEKALEYRGLKWKLKEYGAARAALLVFFAAKKQWIKQPCDLLTIGLRDAYANGLEIALPTSPNELGWAVSA